MLAKLSRELPSAGGMLFEPKWDGFRCIVFRDGSEVELGSRNERPITRYFPELIDPLRDQLPEKCVLDGEVVIAGPAGRLEFEALLQRIHPAESRVRLLAEQTPASFVAFDVLAVGDEDLRPVPQEERRRRLEELLEQARPPLYLTPATTDREVAAEWFSAFEGAGLDGVVAKPVHLPYREDERVMLKVKHERTADCVVAGYRIHKDGVGVGSMLLGLYDDQDQLQHVGVAAAFTVKFRRELRELLEPLTEGAVDTHPWRDWAEWQQQDVSRKPGATSRWNAGKDLSWVPLRPELVVEIKYDQLEGSRLRHTGHFLRWRPDREARSCTYDQLEVPVRYDLAEVLGG
jgi:ATP-dependent DNA ligase